MFNQIIRALTRHCNSTTLSILHAFDTNPSEVCGVFLHFTAQKVKLLIKNLFSKRDLIHRKLWISLYSVNKSLIENCHDGLLYKLGNLI